VVRASLVVITVDDSATALGAISYLRRTCPQVPVIARAKDLVASKQFREAGATHAYPEAIEASLQLGATALQMLDVPTEDVEQMVQSVRDWGYQLVVDPERGK
jgi:monovalent cation:H+ antiporter-2, CPA2 family